MKYKWMPVAVAAMLLTGLVSGCGNTNGEEVPDSSISTEAETPAPSDVQEPEDTEGTETEEITLISKETYYDADGSIIRWYEMEYDDTGNQIKLTNYDADGNTVQWCEVEYDTAGNLVKEVTYNADGSINIDCEYDAFGNVTKELVYLSHDGSFLCWYENEYDESGNLTKQFKLNEDGSMSHEYEYNDAGNLIKDISYDPGEIIALQYEYEYDDLRYITKESAYLYGDLWFSEEYEVEYDASGKPIKSSTSFPRGGGITYEYDYAGNRIKETHFNSDGSINSECEYDAFGNEIKKLSWLDGDFWYWYEYGYDDLGNQIKDISYNEDGSILSGWEREYDAFGNEVKYVSYIDGEISYSCEYKYEYDADGNLTKYIICYDDGSISSWTEYEYITLTLEVSDK